MHEVIKADNHLYRARVYGARTSATYTSSLVICLFFALFYYYLHSWSLGLKKYAVSVHGIKMKKCNIHVHQENIKIINLKVCLYSE